MFSSVSHFVALVAFLLASFGAAEAHSFPNGGHDFPSHPQAPHSTPSHPSYTCLNSTQVTTLVSTLKQDATTLADLSGEAAHDVFVLVETLGKSVFFPNAAGDVSSEVKALVTLLGQIQATVNSTVQTIETAAWQCVTSQFLPQLSPALITWLGQTQQLSQAINILSGLSHFSHFSSDVESLITTAQSVISSSASALSSVTGQLPALFHAFEGGLRTLGH